MNESESYPMRFEARPLKRPAIPLLRLTREMITAFPALALLLCVLAGECQAQSSWE
jgi:hypothetical protein